MVRRITMDEAAADFKGIVERAVANGDSLRLERDGRVIATAAPQPPSPRPHKTLGDVLNGLAKNWPDDDFARDVEDAMRSSRSQVAEDKWERGSTRTS